VLDARAGKSNPRLLIKSKPLRLGPIRQSLPFLLRKKDQPEMTGVDSFLLRRLFRHDVRNKLMTG
jgi:hypothetical protein